MPEKKKIKNVKRTIAFILALIALAFLIIEAMAFLISKDTIVQELSADPQFADMVQFMPTVITILVVSWLVIFAAMSYIVYRIEKRKSPLWLLLIISIISLVFGRIDTAVLGVISSILYIEKKK